MTDHELFRAPAARAEDDLVRNGVTLDAGCGILLALSGGADSVFLLGVLRFLSKKNGFPLTALHVEHGIRGEESLADAAFAREIAEKCGVPFRLVSVNVPDASKRLCIGMEDAARRLRYGALREALATLPGYRYIATGHHETDQAETVLFHLLRGCGGSGAVGIRTVSGDILRPLLGFSAEEIRSFLDTHGIQYCVDSTNADESYDRNLLRRTVLPALSRIRPNPAGRIAASAARIREESDALDEIAEDFWEKNPLPISRSRLAALPKPVFARVLQKMVRDAGGEMAESVHIDAAYAQIKQKGVSRLSFPGGLVLRVLHEEVTFREEAVYEDQPIRIGITELSARNALLGYFPPGAQKDIDDFRIVYKKSKKALVCFDKIIGTLTLRQASPGDAYRYGGMTRSVRKLFSSRKLKESEREAIPVLCDEAGILWIPGFGVREDADGRDVSPSRQACFLYVEKGR